MRKEQYRLMYNQEDSYWWFLAKRYYVNTLLSKLGNNLNYLNILDVGSGTGGMTQYLQRWGNVTSIEPAKEAQKYLKKRNIRSLPITFDAYTEKKKFDLISFLDVLYHQNILDDQAEIEK